jgi:hypothetical protein
MILLIRYAVVCGSRMFTLHSLRSAVARAEPRRDQNETILLRAGPLLILIR